MSNDKKFPHYFKQIPDGVTHVDVYHVLRLFAVDDGAIAHALKKLLCAGKRGSKGRQTDISEAIASLTRCLELDALEQPKGVVGDDGPDGPDGPDGHEGCTGCPTGDEGAIGWCSECDSTFPCYGGTGKPCIRFPKPEPKPKCTHEEIGEQGKADYADAFAEATKIGETLNRLSRDKHKAPVIEFNAIGDMNPAGVINRSLGTDNRIKSVRVRDKEHAINIASRLDNLDGIVTFHWYADAHGKSGKWYKLVHGSEF